MAGLPFGELSGKGLVKKMMKVVGVRFRTAGKVYFFDPLEFEIKRGDNVIVETARGIEFGTAVSDIREVNEEEVVQPLKPVLRLASKRDKDQEIENKQKEKDAFKVCQEKIRKHELDMKLIDVEYTFDNNKILFYFTADGRIDFRELVKDLAAVFKTRIELRQIGVRDETKIMGGIGICGRPLCCHSYLSDFIPVSIKMAKEQNLSLNPTKISGVCGRLMCCLKNEEDTYEELNRRLPNVGDFVTTEDGQKGEVQSVNVLRQLVKVLIEAGDDKELKEYEVEKLRFRKHHGRKDKQNLSPEELKELEKLEKEEAMELEAAEGARSEGNRGDKGSREERSNRQKEQGQRDHGDRRNRQDREKEKGDRPGRGEHPDKNRQDRGNKPHRQENEENPENPQAKEQDGERKFRQRDRDRRNFQNRGDRQDRGNRNGEEGGNQAEGGQQGGRPNGDRQRNSHYNDRHKFHNRGRQDRPQGKQDGPAGE